MKKFLIMFIIMLTSVVFVGCGGSSTGYLEENDNTQYLEQDNNEEFLDLSDFSVGMMASVGGINDRSFNQSAWEGLLRLNEETNANVFYEEPNTTANFAPSLDRFLDHDLDIIWSIGFLTSDSLLEAALLNPDQLYAIVDFAFDEVPENVISVTFAENEAAFLVGYMAGRTTETDVVGFVGGVPGINISRFEFGFRAGVAYAANELGKEIDVLVQYAESFSDEARGRAIATSMITDGADIIFHAAAGAGQGVIDAAVDMNILAIGVDRDQSDLAPNNIMTSAMKFVGDAMADVSKRVAMGEDLAGQTIHFGIAEGGVGIPPFEGSTAELVDSQVYYDTMLIKERIANGEIRAPRNQDEFEEFLNTLGM